MKIEKTELEKFESSLKLKGYRKFSGHFKKEDYGYWKSFHKSIDKYGEKEREHQIAVLIYDLTKHADYKENKIAVQLEFLLSNEEVIDRMDLSITDDNMTVERFEEVCEKFYHDVYLNYIKLHFKKN